MATTKLGQNQLNDYNFNNSLSRQAIINGNFDVWQRGTSLALSSATFQFLADRWQDYHSADGGTLPTLTRTREVEADDDGSFFYSKLAFNGAGTSLGNNSVGQYFQRIENGTRNLCGNGKKVTISFWAKSDVANKRIGLRAIQNYGTGGSPSADEIINGTNFTLTSTWTKYTYTFTTNTLSGKTFGTNYDDRFEIFLTSMWGSTRQAQYNSTSAETYVGAGYVGIKKVQLCAGDVALPFMPKSFEEELRACQRYTYGIYTDQVNSVVGIGYEVSTTVAGVFIQLPVEMRSVPTITITPDEWQIADGTVTKDCTNIILSTTGCSKKGVLFVCTVADSLAVSRPCRLQGDGTANRILILSAEL